MSSVYKVDVLTDANGRFDRTEIVNPPGWFNLTVELTARLVAPPNIEISGYMDVDQKGGGISNEAYNFHARTGELVDLGVFKLSGGDNMLVITGQTSPMTANVTLEFEVKAAL